MDASRGSSNIFPMPQIPALLVATPPPAAMALPSSSLALSSYSSSSSSLRGHGHAPPITSFPILMLTVLGILAASVLLLAYYVFVIRCCLTWHRGSRSTSSGVAGLIVSSARRPQRARSNTTSASVPADDDAEPRGLEDAAIRALPAFSYRKKKPAAAEPSAPASECAVCLAEFDEGDTVRMLPACLHVFHLACVDAWLQGNTSCPVCRADVAATLCRLLPPPLPPLEEEAVAVQVVVVPGATEEDGHDTPTLAHQRAATVAPAVEIQGEATYTDHLLVGGDKTKTTVPSMAATA